QLENTATVTDPPGIVDPVPSNNSATDIDTLTPQADLTLLKTMTTPQAVPGAPVSYNITVTNLGPSSVSSLTLTDLLPPILLNPIFSPTVPGIGSYNSISHDFDLSSPLGTGGQVSLTLTGIIDPAATGSITNTAIVSSPVDPNSTNNTSSVTSPLIPQ